MGGLSVRYSQHNINTHNNSTDEVILLLFFKKKLTLVWYFCLYYSGFYPKGGGEVILETSPIQSINSFDFLDRGEIVDISGHSFVAGSLPMKVCIWFLP